MEQPRSVLMSTGRCACGAVKYQANAKPLAGVHCQCRDCQRRSGTGHITEVVFNRCDVDIRGDVKYYRKSSDGGNVVARGFCFECGSPMFAYVESDPETLAVTASSLDDPSLFKPTCVIFTDSAQPWDDMDPQLSAFPKMPPA